MACLKCQSGCGVFEFAVPIWRRAFSVLHTKILDASASSCSAAPRPLTVHSVTSLRFLTNRASILMALAFYKRLLSILYCPCILDNRFRCLVGVTWRRAHRAWLLPTFLRWWRYRYLVSTVLGSGTVSDSPQRKDELLMVAVLNDFSFRRVYSVNTWRNFWSAMT